MSTKLLDRPGTSGGPWMGTDPAPETFSQTVVSPENRLRPDGTAREVLRCRRCELVQFRTASGFCRRCSHSLVPPPEAALDANKPVSGITLADSLFPPEESPALDKDALGRAVGRRIRRLRRERQWTQQQLCRKVGAPRSYISRMENARLTPGLAMLYRIAAALEVEMVDLLTHDARRNSAEEFWGFLARSLSRLHSQQISAVLCHVRRMARANTPCRLAS